MNNIKKLPDSELEIMMVIWDANKCYIRLYYGKAEQKLGKDYCA